MSRINSISVNHVKGIESLNIACDIYPNKPNFLVAPNGSGKSSLATAFSSLNSRRLRLDESNLYQDTEWEDSSVSISFDDGTSLYADLSKNEISGEMDIQVIRSGLYANMTNRRVGPRVLSQTKMSIQQCVVCEKVPERVSLDYSVVKERQKYPKGISSKMRNLKDQLSSYRFLRDLLNCELAFNSTRGGRYCATINNFFKAVIFPGEEAGREGDITSLVSSVKPLFNIKDLLKKYYPDESEITWYIDAVQINRFIEGKESVIKKACERLKYQEIKNDASDMLGFVNRTRYTIRPRETRGRLVVDFPDWGEASNGEIDVLQLCAALFRSRAQLGKREKSLLIIDEVFDYLDDANLVVAQYFLLEMMRQFKADGKQLYIVILTHLDPSLFKSYRFKHFHTSYFDLREEGAYDGWLTKLLVDRFRCQKEQKEIYDAVSSHYLHFSLVQKDDGAVSSYVSSKGSGERLKEPGNFREEMESRLVKYLHRTPFSPPEICCGLRIVVEKLCYDALLADGDREEYLNILNGTEARLSFAEDHGVIVPEAIHLLGSIYNSCMHLTGASGENELVYRQLSNEVIRRLIEKSLKALGWIEPRPDSLVQS